MKTKQKVDFSSLLFLLEEGLSIREISSLFHRGKDLSEEESQRFLLDNMAMSLRRNFQSFRPFLSLKQALFLSLQVQQMEKERKDYLRKKLLYPLFLFVTSIFWFGYF